MYAQTCYFAKNGKAFKKASDALREELRELLQDFALSVKTTPVYPLKEPKFAEKRLEHFKSYFRELESKIFEYQKTFSDEISEEVGVNPSTRHLS